MIARQCNYVKCRQEYEAEQRYLNRGQGIYCSVECSAAANSGPRVMHEPNTTCAVCDARFYRKPSSKKSKSGLFFCSRTCQSRGFRSGSIAVSPGPKPKTEKPTKTKRQERIDSWLSGEWDGSTPHRGELSSTIRNYLLDSCHYRCTKCGWSETNPSTGKVPLNIDHIDGNYKNNAPNNLRVLCPNCHALTPTYGALNVGNGRSYRKSAYGYS